MIKIKKIFFLTLILLIFIERANTEISDSLFMTIGDKPITQSDLVNEIKIILILNNESYSNEKRDQLHEIAVNSTIKRNIKQLELERNNYFSFSQEDFDKELIRLASNAYVDLETLKNICASNDLDFSIIEDQVKVELYWNSLIFELYKNKLTINPTQIEERLKLMQNKKELSEYLVSEIIIKNVEKSLLKTEIENLKNKIEIEGFENVAKELSISASAMKGGDLGWVNESIMSEKIRSKIINTPINALSDPILLSEGTLIFKVRDKRTILKNQSLEEMKNQIISSEKIKILNIHSLSHYDRARRSISVKFYNE